MPAADEEAELFAEHYVAEMRDINASDIVYWETLDDWIREEPAKAWSTILAISRIASEIELGRLW
jgi:hypothetical protein